MVPVNVRAAADHGRLGNRVSFMMAPLPLAERDPARRLRRVAETMQGLKQSKQRRGGEILEEVSDRIFSGLFAQVARLGATTLPYNIVVPTSWDRSRSTCSGHCARLPAGAVVQNQALGVALQLRRRLFGVQR
jgi:hypothetical protein